MQVRFLICIAGLAAGLFSLFASTGPVQAQAVYTWSGGGSGTWDITDNNWGGNGSNTFWDSFNGPSNVADFKTAGALVTVDTATAPIYANGIIFDQAATINGSTLSLASQGGSIYSTPTITVNASGGTITSVMTGYSGLVTGGPGVLTLTGSSYYTGGATVSSGTLQLVGGAFSTTANSYSISSGAVLALSLSGVANGGNTGQSEPGGTTTFSGAGTLSIVNGWLNNPANSGSPQLVVAMGAGGLINVASGAGIQNGGWSNANWNSNLAPLNLNGTIDLWDSGGGVTVDALNGSGTVTHTNYGNAEPLTVGVANGSGTFSGTITDNIASGQYGAQPTLYLVKTGTGTQVLSGNNSYSAGTQLNGGILVLANATGSALGSGTVAISSGTLQVGNGGPGSLSSSNAILNNDTLLFNQNGVASQAAPISGAGNLLQWGPGTVNLSAGNTYNGTTVVSGGVLALTGTGAINSTSGIAVNGPTAKFLQTSGVASTPAINLSQGTLDGTGTVGNVSVADLAANTVAAGNGSSGTLTTGNLTFNGAATISLPAGSLLNVGGTLSVLSPSSTITIDPSRTSWTAGTYKLIGYGSYSGANFSDFQLGTVGGLTARQSIVGLTNNTGSDEIDLTVSGNSTYWTGADSLHPTQWTTNTSVLNWELTPANSPTYYLNGDTPLFDDRATGSTTVDISGSNVYPTSVTFNNNVKSYTLLSSGGYGIAGAATLVISGSGTVTITNSNGFTGGTTFGAGNGLLNLGNASAIGSGPLTISGGSLDNTTGSPMTLSANNSQNWNNSFTFVGSSALNVGTGAVTMNASPTLYVSASTLTVGGAINGAGALTKNGGGTLVLAGNNGYSGGTTLANGTLVLNNNSAIGGGPLTINGGTLDTIVGGVTLPNNRQNWNADVFFNGSQSLNMGTGAVTLGSSRTVTVRANSLTVGGVISDDGNGYSLTKAGAGSLILQAQNTFSGGTVVNAGTLVLATGGQSGTITGPLTVNPGATVSLQAGDALGYGNGTCVTTVNVNGSVLDNATNSNNAYLTNFVLNGGTMSSSGGGTYNFSTGFGITTLSSRATSVISSGITIRDQNNLDFNVAAGTTASGIDLVVSGQLIEPYPWTASNGIIKDGSGVMYAAQVNYFGNTTVNGGTLVLGQFPATYAWNFPNSPESTTFSVAAGAALNFQISDSEYPLWLNTLFTGGGAITKSGSGSVTLGSYGGAVVNTFSMSPGALISVTGGELQLDDYSGAADFTNNYSSLNIAAGALLEAMQSNVQIDSLTGAGTYQAGWYAPRTLTIGINNGSGTFSGTIQGNGLNGYSQPVLNKVGTGVEVLNGTLNFHGGYGASTIFVTGGSAGSPSTLVISPTGASMIGTIDPGNSFGDGGVSIGTNGGDNALLIQTAGTIGAQSAWIGTFGSGTLSIAGGTFLVGAGNLNAAFNNGGSAWINVSGGKLGFLNNANANLGAYYGAPATVNQTGGFVAFYSDTGGLTLGGSGGVVINGGGTYTYNLAGGTLAAPGVSWTSPEGGAGGGSYVFNFNGGVLQTTASTGSYFAVPASPATATLNVAAGGAIINTLGNSVTIQEDLLHSGGTAVDGGLTLLGGELILSGSNTYNGGTVVADGELILSSPSAILDGSSLTVGGPGAFAAPAVSIANGAVAGSAITAVPEPGTLALLAAGVAAVGAVIRKRNRALTRSVGR
jgi:autotransporter-associated beta strand protein